MHDGVQSRDAVTHGMILGFVPAFFVWGRQGPCTGCLAALDVINAMDYCSVENMNGPGQPPAQEMTFPAASRTAPAHLCSTKPAESGLSMIGHHGCTCAHPHAYAHTRTCVHTRALLNIHTHYVEACAFLVSTHIHTHRHAHTHTCARVQGAPLACLPQASAPQSPLQRALCWVLIGGGSTCLPQPPCPPSPFLTWEAESTSCTRMQSGLQQTRCTRASGT